MAQSETWSVRDGKGEITVRLRGAVLRIPEGSYGTLYITATDYQTGDIETPEASASAAMVNALAHALTSVSDADSERWLHTLATMVESTRDTLGPLFQVPAS